VRSALGITHSARPRYLPGTARPSESVLAMRSPMLLIRVAGGKLNRFAERNNLVIER